MYYITMTNTRIPTLVIGADPKSFQQYTDHTDHNGNIWRSYPNLFPVRLYTCDCGEVHENRLYSSYANNWPCPGCRAKIQADQKKAADKSAAMWSDLAKRLG